MRLKQKVHRLRPQNPPLIADHFAPIGAAPDFPPQQRLMGVFSDGAPVTPLVVEPIK